MCVCILIQYHLSLAHCRISQYAPIAIHQNKCTLMERRHSLTISQPRWTCPADQVSSSLSGWCIATLFVILTDCILCVVYLKLSESADVIYICISFSWYNWW